MIKGGSMSTTFNRKAQKLKRQYLRNNATKAERFLWSKLKEKQLQGFKFRRQHGIGPFIVDFYSHTGKLAIEIDGDIHFTEAAQEYDRRREEYIREYGVRFLRFTNYQVLRNLDGVLDAIAAVLQSSTTPDTSHLPPPR
jgi:very-short-patch-repair endonuclease